ncbi:MAG TPA: hypothetical protein VJT74_16615 [Pyrinomonadaceae bacterium]|nr:hypothetical protein [Pyrinomonadaceae bacterium]
MIICACAAVAQDGKCTLKLAELTTSPELRGFRVGMTVEEVRARLPKAQFPRADEFGFASLNIFPDYEQGIDKKSFEGVRTVSLEFMDNKVSAVWLGYDKTFKWQTIDEFVAGITPALKLPNLWRSRFRNRLMDCADFTVAVIPVGDSPSIKITSDAARALLDERKAAKEETVEP